MRRVRVGIGAVVGVALAVACGSSSNKAPADAGEDSSVSNADSGPPPVPCNMTAGSPLCATGMTCCTPGLDVGSLLGDFTGGGAGTPSLTSLLPTPSCVPTGSCNGTAMDCTSASNCSGDQVCCSGMAIPDGGIDAEADAGGVNLAGALAGALGGGTLNLGTATTCQTSCMPGQQQTCASDKECTGGQTCQAGFPGFPGIGDGGNPFAAFLGGDGGSPFGGLFGGGDDAAATMYCFSPPDAGTGSDASTADATAPSDASPTSDASSDASGADEAAVQ